jgi:lysozyme
MGKMGKVNGHLRYSDEAFLKTKEQETFVPFVYDDAVPNRSFVWVDGKRYGYKPWDGGHVYGTLSIGYGHTNAARHPLKCELHLTITEKQGAEILRVDLGECEDEVKNVVHVPLTQGQFDCLTDFEFNSGRVAEAGFTRELNKGIYDAVPAGLRQYIYTTVKGKDGTSRKIVAPGLRDRRRPMEITMWLRADKAVEPDADDHDDVDVPGGNVVPDAVPVPAPKPMAQSKTILGIVLAGLATLGREAWDLVAQVMGFISYVPEVKYLIFALIVLGLGWAAWGRFDVRKEHGV